MSKEYTALGLMSGTSGDGVDASIIISDGINTNKVIHDKYFEYDSEIYKNIHNLKDRINSKNNLKDFSKDLNILEKKITLFHAKVVKELSGNKAIDLVGFHGQTIYHNSKEKISKQLGDGKLLSQLTNKNIVYNFRQNDIKNGGEGAPLTPIFHQLILKQKKIDVPSCILNIGGISNITIVENYKAYNFTSRDIGPGNCLIDSWVRQNSEKKFDKDGAIASRGTINEIILEQAQELYSNRPNQNTLSLDVNDFDVSFARGLSLEDGVATLTDFTGRIIGAALFSLLNNVKKNIWKVLISGGGRKNKSLISRIKKSTPKNIILQPIDDYSLNGDFIESQAFAYLAIRSYIGEPISFPQTTGCSKPSYGGQIIQPT
tara:strand:+ start:8064 stop:9185 length:1122 start_codon:yes stop_codon:yes gene_type:complete